MNHNISKRSLAYESIYGSDIFNQHPPKDPEYQKFLQRQQSMNKVGNLNESNQMKRILSSTRILPKYRISLEEESKQNKNQLDQPIHTQKPKENLTKVTTDYCRRNNNYKCYLNEFHNIQIKENLPQKTTKGTMYKELIQAQPLRYSSQHNRIESLKSNIFNDRTKEEQNGSTNSNLMKIQHNNWNTNLDWKNSQCELLFQNDFVNKPNENKFICDSMKDYYQSKNILSHKYQIPYAKDVDIIKLQQEFKKKGMHLYNLQCNSDFLKSHNNPVISFDVRENNDRVYRANLQELSEEQKYEINKDGVQVINTSNYKVNVDPKTYYSKKVTRTEFLGNDRGYQKIGGLRK